MQQIAQICPHCMDSDHLLEKNGFSWLKCPQCELSFRPSELGKTITAGHLPDYILDKLYFKDVDNQMEKIVSESTDNLMHEIIMTRIFQKRAEKAKNQEIRSRIDKIFDTALNRV